jgi:hypothetical protein
LFSRTTPLPRSFALSDFHHEQTATSVKITCRSAEKAEGVYHRAFFDSPPLFLFFLMLNILQDKPLSLPEQTSEHLPVQVQPAATQPVRFVSRTFSVSSL